MKAPAFVRQRPKAGIGRPPERIAGHKSREDAMTQPNIDSAEFGSGRSGPEVDDGVIWNRREAKDGVDIVAAAVANALYWDLALPRDRVVCRCNDGWVTLTGEVERTYQRSSAEADVRRVQGVRGVTNAIKVGAGAAKIGGSSATEVA
jgi:hypothetical protein